MLTWKTWDGIGDEWDENLLKFPDYTVYQSFSWGEHRGAFGWCPVRMVGEENGSVVCAAQVLVRHLPLGIKFAWIPGGPVGAPAIWAGEFPKALQAALGCRLLYCRANNMRPDDPLEVQEMSAYWRRPESCLHTGLSAAYIPAGSEAERVGRTSKNWGRNLRRAQKQGNTVRLWESPEPETMHRVYLEMQEYKSLGEQFSREALASILNRFGKQCVVVRCDDGDGNLLAFRGALLFGDRGWDIFAATSTVGRKVYASHAAFWELMNRCIGLGVKWYDMSGVDPERGKGVYDFKKGTGAEDLKFLGEWDTASFPLLRRFANFAVKWRIRSM
ncbi:MAG: peptidoglycan bridge formation glycyltransferase FemA/FemB family protein [Terrimicrobiaceae bacterium]